MSLTSNTLDVPKAEPNDQAASARTLANRRNALKSTGPRTEAGKAASRRNAVKSGLTGAGVVLPMEMEAERGANVEAWKRSLRPGDEVEAQLIEVAASTMVRLRRCWREEALARARAVDRADRAWDLDREAEAGKLTARLAKDPVAVAPSLRRTLHGARWMLAQWAALGDVLEAGEAWSAPQRQLALDLLAVPAIFRDGRTRLDRPSPGEEAEARRGLVASESARLGRDIEGSLADLDEGDRALQRHDVVLMADGEVGRLCGYESRLNGRLARYLDRIWSKRGRPAEAKPEPREAPMEVAPEPTPDSEPAPAPIVAEAPPEAPEPTTQKPEESPPPPANLPPVLPPPPPAPRGGPPVVQVWATPRGRFGQTSPAHGGAGKGMPHERAGRQDRGRGPSRPGLDPSKRSQ